MQVYRPYFENSISDLNTNRFCYPCDTYLQIQFPAVTVCNQNRVDCQKLEEVKTMCELIEEYSNLDLHEDANIGANSSEANNGSLVNRNNVTMLTSLNDSITFENATSRKHTLWKKYQLKGIFHIKKTSPEYTICQKMSVSERKTILQYLFDEGKCGKICRKGISIIKITNPYYLHHT